MPAVQLPQLVIPFAKCSSDAWAQTMQALPADSLKNLSRLLMAMKPVQTSTGTADSLSPPHERVLGQLEGLTGAEPIVDGLIPWAAWEASTAAETRMISNKAWAFITPCHWAMGREHASMTDPQALALTPEQSRILMAAMQPYFETEGITLHYAAAERWLAEGEVFRQLPTASLDRVLGRNVDRWLPAVSTAAALRRLQNEMQMLLYTHPINDERSMHRLRPVNSFWLSGSGAISQALQSPAKDLTVARGLAPAAFADDWSAYAQAWGQLDAGDIARLLARQRSGESVRLTLCGECNARTFETASRGVFARISSLLVPQPAFHLLEQL